MNDHILGDAIAGIVVVIALGCLVAAIILGSTHSGSLKACDATFYVILNEDLRENVIEHLNKGEAVYIDGDMKINVIGTLSSQKQFMWKQYSDKTPNPPPVE